MGPPYCFGRFTLDPVARKLYEGSVPVPMGPTDFRLLLALVESAGTIVTKDELIALVGGRTAAGESVLYVHISSLRKTLGSNCIVSQQGRGYRFVTPVRRSESHLGNLPSLWRGKAETGPSRLIGRSEHLRFISNLVRQGRLVTLTGPGGVGKTRLALQAASQASQDFCDGVWLVELATLNDPDLIASAIASALGIKIGVNAAPLDALVRYMARKSQLILLDNCEHVVAPTARIAEVCLSSAPGLKILATSRQSLSCSGEQVFDVPPLSVPEGGMPPDLMRSVAAVDLFIERATEAHANIQIGDNELETVARICRRLDGLPLAIEMAAGWAGPLGLETLHEKLDGSLKAWLRARSTAPPRHSTLRATLEWSHALLSVVERAVLRRLAVFAGSFSMEGAEAVAADDAVPSEKVFEVLANLTRKSMVAVVPGSRAQRFRLLGTTGSFMLEELASSDEGHSTRHRHARYVLRLLERSILELETTSDAAWLERYGPSLDDVRAALDWALRENSEMAVALAGASWPLWQQMSLRAEGRQRLGVAAAQLNHGTSPALEARLRRGLGEMFLNTAAMNEAYEEIERAAILYRTLGDPLNLGSALAVLANLLLMLDRTEEAERAILEALNLLEPVECLRTRAAIYSLKLCIDASLGRFDAARLAGENAARLCELAGNERTALVVAANLVQVLLESGDVVGAISAGHDVALRLRGTRHSDLRGFALGVLAASLISRGDLDEALMAASEAAPLLRDEGTLYWLFDHLALRAACGRRAKDAALIAGYAENAYQEVGRQREPMGRNAVEQLRALLSEVLPADELARLGELGACLSEDRAIALALSA